MALVTLYDSAGGSWPPNPAFLIAYNDSWGGDWKGVHYETNVLLAKAKWPKAWIVQTSVIGPGAPNVALYDCEKGALSVEEVCADANTELVKKQRRPSLYGTQSTRDLIGECLNQFYTRWQLGRDIDYVLADWDGVPNVTEGNVGHQYATNNAFDTTVADRSWGALRGLHVP